MRSKERIAAIRSTGHPGPHLTDDQLMETYVVAGDDRHLAVCRDCKARFDDLVRALEQVREDVVREADTVFTADRLQEQHDRIMRRLERHGHPAEVVMFPQRTASQPAVQRVLGPARRWVAAAAAAGLAAGMFLGFTLDRRTHYAAINRGTQESAPTSASGSAKWQAAMALDEQFFSEIDAALTASRAREMRTELDAIDVMTTPAEIRDASVGLR